MQRLLMTGSGGAIGALARYGAALLMPSSGNGIPYATLFINGIGCFVLACMTYSLFNKRENERLKLFFGTGLCGGFTTMSTFSLEMTSLLANNPFYGLIYLFLSMFVGLAMAWLGFLTVSRMGRRAN